MGWLMSRRMVTEKVREQVRSTPTATGQEKVRGSLPEGD